MVLNDAIDRAEAESCTFANRFRRVERVEDALWIAKARASVRELEDHVAFLALPGDLEHPTAGFTHRVHCVFDDLDASLEELVGVAAYGRKMLPDGNLQLDLARLAPGFHQLSRTIKEKGQIDDNFFARRLPREAEEIGHEVTRAARLIHDLAKKGVLIVGELLF